MTEESSFIVQGSVSTVAVAFLQAAVLRMVPFAAPAIVLLALDLLYGIRAAKCRGERARLSTAVRRTMTKLFGYVCWLILASTLALSFHQDWLEWLVLGLVYVNEGASIAGNYLETKGLDFQFAGFIKLFIRKFLAKKAGVEVTPEEADEIIKPKRDPKTGKFVKRDETA